jgi:hypothetical protein
VADDVRTEGAPVDHSKGAIDLEVMTITSENPTTSDGLDAAKNCPEGVYR